MLSQWLTTTRMTSVGAGPVATGASQRAGGGRDSSVLLRLADVRKSYANLEVLKGIDLSIADGEFITVLGPSGSGKTTVLRLIGGFIEPTTGQILLDGRDIARWPPYQRPFNTVFQDYALFPHLTVAENVAYGLTVRRVRRAEVRARTQQALERVALSGFETRYPTQLSGGQRQRVALARAIVCEPRLVLLDEPLGALDAELRRQMQSFLKRLQRDLRTTFLFVTHDQEEAITMADRIVVMDHGAIIQIGAPDDVYYRPNSAYVARFFGDNNLISCRVIGPEHVHTPFGPMRVDTAPLVPGTDAWLVVRPEVIGVAPGVDVDNRAALRVTEISFAGATTEIKLVGGAEGATVIALKLPSRSGGPRVAVGDVCEVGWAWNECCTVTREAS